MGVEFWRLDEVPGAERPDLWEELLSETQLPWSVRVSGGGRIQITKPGCAGSGSMISPWPHLGTAEDVGKPALYLSSDDAEMVTGSMQVPDGGYTVG